MEGVKDSPQSEVLKLLPQESQWIGYWGRGVIRGSYQDVSLESASLMSSADQPNAPDSTDVFRVMKLGWGLDCQKTVPGEVSGQW